MTMTDDARVWARAAETADAEAIAAIHVRTWRQGYRGLVPDSFLDGLSLDARKQWWRDMLTGGRTTTLVAERGKAMLGWINLASGGTAGAMPGICTVQAFFVAPEYRRSGTARVLWSLARRFLRDAGFRTATAWVLASDVAARAAYEHLGWHLEPGAQRKIHLGGAEIAEVRYRIDLG